MELTQAKVNNAFAVLKDDFGYANPMAAPKITKVVVSAGTGKRAKVTRDWNAHVQDRLTKITGQQPALRQAKKSIATFKLREGDQIGVTTTLRGEKALSFVDKLIHIALPRTRDFRGIAATGVDQMGNLTIGIKEHTIFPIAADEDLQNVFGLAITIVTTAKTQAEAMAFFTYLGVPFKKEVEKKGNK